MLMKIHRLGCALAVLPALASPTLAGPVPSTEPTALYYALSTIAQCAAALAALIGFLGLWRLDRLREEAHQIEQTKWRLASVMTSDDLTRLNSRQHNVLGQQPWLLWALRGFLVVTLFILGVAVVGLLHVDWLKTWLWTPWLLWIAGGWLAVGPIIVVFVAARLSRTTIALALLLALASPALAGPSVRCTTSEEKTLHRLQTLCDDGTRAVSTWSPMRREDSYDHRRAPPTDHRRYQHRGRPAGARA
jgi:hypothetical protein